MILCYWAHNAFCLHDTWDPLSSHFCLASSFDVLMISICYDAPLSHISSFRAFVNVVGFLLAWQSSHHTLWLSGKLESSCSMSRFSQKSWVSQWLACRNVLLNSIFCTQQAWAILSLFYECLPCPRFMQFPWVSQIQVTCLILHFDLQQVACSAPLWCFAVVAIPIILSILNVMWFRKIMVGVYKVLSKSESNKEKEQWAASWASKQAMDEHVVWLIK